MHTAELPKVPGSNVGKPWAKPLIPISGLSSIQSVKRRGFWSVVLQHRFGANRRCVKNDTRGPHGAKGVDHAKNLFSLCQP